MKVLIPGSFDPPTNGHIEVIRRASKVFDEVFVGVVVNPQKNPMFEVGEREKMLAEIFDGITNIKVESFEGLLVDFAKEMKINAIVKGLRAMTDFDYEFQMASMNAKLAPDVETVCLMASDRHQFIASRLVKEISVLGGDVGQFVSSRVREKLEAKVKKR